MWKAVRNSLVAAGVFVGAILGAAIGFGGGLPLIPSTPQYNEPSQIINTLNAVISQMNGNALGSGGYAAQPQGIVSIGSFCNPAAGATPLTCNATRGLAPFTGVGTIADGATVSVVINNSLVTAANVCQSWIAVDGTAAASAPFVRSTTTGAGTITVALSNGSATATGSSSISIGFACTA